MGLVAALAACAVLCAPAVASATTGFSWSQPGDFTATAPGANPEHKYGEPSWLYSPSTFDSSFTGADGSTAYAGWVDSSTPTTWIGVPASGTPMGLQMVPPQGGAVSMTWTAPAAEQITASGSVTEPEYGTGTLTTCAGTTWTLTNGANTVSSGSGAGSTNDLSGSATVAAGGTLVFTVTDASGILNPYSTSCDDTEVVLSLSAPAPASAATLTSPTANQTFTSGQPTFSGAAGNGFGYDSGITVKLYSGSAVSGAPAQTLTTTESGGSWSVAPTALQNGTYTAEAEQNDVLSNTDTSSPVTFTVAHPSPAPPTVTLNSLGSAPLKTSRPTFTGTGGTAAGDSVVDVFVAPAAHPNQAVGYTTAPVGSNGDFSAQLPSALPDGQYVAVAAQAAPGGEAGLSSQITFSIKIHPPVVTLTTPAAGASLAQQGATFTGTATDVYGDSNTVLVSLWSGTSDKGTPTSTASAAVTGTTWSVTWPHRLPLGLYTVRASQSDDAGHIAYTGVHTFLIVPSQTTIGDAVTITKSGQVSVPITCLAAAGSKCTGSVLVLTTKSYRPTSGGPKGQLKVLFEYVTIRGGATVVVRGTIKGAVAKLLVKNAPLSVRVMATLASASAKPVTDSGTRTLKLTK
jgi:large repetitive protein